MHALVSLLTRLVLPLLTLFGLTVAAHFAWGLDGFFLNLSTELLGMLFTICYVDWILRRHEQRRWESTDDRIANRLQILLNATITGLRTGLGFGADVLDQHVCMSLDPIAIHKDVMRIGEHIIAPAARLRVQALDQEGWSRLARQIRNAHEGVSTFLNMFQSRLSPEQISCILDLQDALVRSLTFYYTFPDIMGVPPDKLPSTRTSPELLQQFGCESTAKELESVCSLVKKLSESVDHK